MSAHLSDSHKRARHPLIVPTARDEARCAGHVARLVSAPCLVMQGLFARVAHLLPLRVVRHKNSVAVLPEPAARA